MAKRYMVQISLTVKELESTSFTGKDGANMKADIHQAFADDATQLADAAQTPVIRLLQAIGQLSAMASYDPAKGEAVFPNTDTDFNEADDDKDDE